MIALYIIYVIIIYFGIGALIAGMIDFIYDGNADEIILFIFAVFWPVALIVYPIVLVCQFIIEITEDLIHKLKKTNKS